MVGYIARLFISLSVILLSSTIHPAAPYQHPAANAQAEPTPTDNNNAIPLSLEHTQIELSLYMQACATLSKELADYQALLKKIMALYEQRKNHLESFYSVR